MLTSPTARPATTDLTFFSSKSNSRGDVVQSTSNVVVRTRIATDVPQNPAILPRQLPAQVLAAAKRRKLPVAVSAVDLPRQVKRLRHSPASCPPRASASKQSSGAKRRATSVTRLPSPEPIYRSSRSRSTSAFPSGAPVPVERPCWTDEDGHPGGGAITSESVVKELMKGYKQYFRNLDDPNDKSWEPHPTDYPWAELEYPNNEASERFILLAPKDKDHYSPIMCLQKSLHTIVEFYLTPAQQSLFGTIPSKTLSDDNDDLTPPPSRSPTPSPPSSQSSQHSGSSSLTSLSSSTKSSNIKRVNYLRAVQRAIHTCDGPLFVKSLNTINGILRTLKYPKLPLDLDPFEPGPCNPLKEAVKGWTLSGLPEQVMLRIVDETYQRCVGPHVRELGRYEAFSSSVYGELMPSLISDIVTATALSPSSLLLDLGSGVGNVVTQASLQSGCTSFGVELMPVPAKVSLKQLEEFKRRCRMWGVSIGDVHLEEGDMLTSRKVSELMGKADVVLVNNKVFREELNEALRPKFLDLKEGAVVVSLKPFVSSLNARVTERNVDDISAIFDVTEREYHSGSVSWASLGGSYYMHRVDREGYASIRQRFEDSRAGGRNSRLRK